MILWPSCNPCHLIHSVLSLMAGWGVNCSWIMWLSFCNRDKCADWRGSISPAHLGLPSAHISLYKAWHLTASQFHGLFLLRGHRFIGIRIPIINLRRSSDRLRFKMGIPIPVRLFFFANRGPYRIVNRDPYPKGWKFSIVQVRQTCQWKVPIFV